MNNKKFTKKNLKAGYIVKMRDGSLNIVTINDSDNLIMVDKNGDWMHIDSYTEDLRNNGSYSLFNVYADPKYDIVEVYGGCRLHHRALVLDVEDRKLLWTREPEKTCDSCAHKVVCTHVGMCEHYLEKAE
jgi:hypothetical protein